MQKTGIAAKSGFGHAREIRREAGRRPATNGTDDRLSVRGYPADVATDRGRHGGRGFECGYLLGVILRLVGNG